MNEDKNAGTPRKRRVKPGTTWAEDVPKEPIFWVVPDYIPRRVVSSIYAPRDAGKTMAAIWLAARLSRGSKGTPPLRVWYNSQEDDLASILRPRLDAAEASLDRQVRLTDNHWRLPRDLTKIADELRQHRAGGALDDVLILDSIQQHIIRPYALTPAQETIKGLLSIAIDFDMAVILIGHTTKGKHGSVEAMISGATVLQNMSKAIYVFGPEPGTKIKQETGEEEEQGNPRYVLACERMGVAPKPVSILFERKTTEDKVTGRPEPYLQYLGPSSFTARDVLDEAKTDDRDSDEASKTSQAAWWIRRVLGDKGPMPTRDLEELAKADGTYHSRNTFDRARKIAGVESYQDAGQWWVRLRDENGE